MSTDPPLDRIDFAILHALQRDALLSNKELAATVGLAPSSCHARVRRLRELGVLKRTRTEVDPHAVGVGLQAMVFVHLQTHDRSSVEAFRAHALGLAEVVSVTHLGGRHDFAVRVGVRDARHLRDLAMDAFTTRSEVRTIETAVVFEHVPGHLPLLRGPGRLQVPDSASRATPSQDPSRDTP